MNPEILNSTVQNFIDEHLNDDITRILLKKSPFEKVSSRELAEQIESKRRCEKKLPAWYKAKGIYYPAKLSVEQCSSELTALYKSSLAAGDKLIDLTGGFGVDSYYFSLKVKDVICCEQNAELSDISKHNAKLLGSDNVVFINTDSIQYLRNTNDLYDTLFADPSRRIKSNKVFMLKDCEPDVAGNLDILLSKARRIIIKTSPLLDIQAGLKELRHVSAIHVVSIKNDCKELLWIIDKDFIAEPEIHCAAISEQGQQDFIFNLQEERAAFAGSYSMPEIYIYEPDVALLKAGCFKLISERYGIKKLHPNTHLYTSSDLITGFIGRRFKTISVSDYKSFMKNNIVRKANVITRNFPHSAEELKKKHKIEDGGNDYLLFTIGPENQLLIIHSERL